MDGLASARELIGSKPMPMAELFDFELLEVERGNVRARAVPSHRHANPFGVTQGGFASTVLDIALGLVSISVLAGDALSVATTDLTVRYVRGIDGDAGPMDIQATVIHSGRTIVIAEARLYDEAGKLIACAQSNSVVRYPN